MTIPGDRGELLGSRSVGRGTARPQPFVAAGDPEAAGEIILHHSNVGEWGCITRVGIGWENPG